MFIDLLPAKMAFYNHTMKNKDLANVISDCYLELGRRQTIKLLDRMKEVGFRESTRSGLSFAASDLKTPDNKEKVITAAETMVLKKQKLYEKGVITAKERYEQVLDTWTHASYQDRDDGCVQERHP